MSSSAVMAPNSRECPGSLLQLPEAALSNVLQMLLRQDPQSLFSCAMTCRQLSTAVPAHAGISQIKVCCSISDTVEDLIEWLERHKTSLVKLTSCTIHFSCGRRQAHAPVRYLPCPQLRRLDLQGVQLHSDQEGGCPSALQDCTGLTALSLQYCTVPDVQGVFAALPELRSLHVGRSRRSQGADHTFAFTQLQQPLKLTHLSLDTSWHQCKQLDQLSALVNLEHLAFKLDRDFPPGGLPSQLVSLTALHIITYEFEESKAIDAAEQFAHLSSLTALQRLAVKCRSIDNLARDLAGIGQLSKLTRLELNSSTLDFTTASTSSWARLTALETLELHECDVQPAALAAFTQLRALRLHKAGCSGGSPQEALLTAVSNLQLLTELEVALWRHRDDEFPRQAAFTAVTASTKLCCLKLQLLSNSTATHHDVALFKPQASGTSYPCMRVVDLACDGSCKMPLSEQQLELLCSCCPAVDSLAFVMCRNPSPTTCLPLLQLVALTDLRICGLGSCSAGTAVAADAVAQLTGLLQLSLYMQPASDDTPNTPAALSTDSTNRPEAARVDDIQEYIPAHIQ